LYPSTYPTTISQTPNATLSQTIETSTPASGAQKQDYGDKAINAVQKKFGIDKSGKYDKYEEKGSDMLRGQFEKSSGKKMPDKFSN
jgi:hypothetical protein